MGCYDDFENADVFVLWGSNMAEMHPILWTRITDRRISAPHVRIHTLSTYEHRTTDLSDAALIFKPGTDLAILNYIANYIVQTKAVNRDFIDKHVNFRVANTDIGYGLRPEHVLEQRALHANDAQVSQPSSLRRLRQDAERVHARPRLGAQRRLQGAARGARQGLCGPEDQGHVAVDHGVQPARPRRVGEPPRLQHPPAHRENCRARQQPVLADRPALRLRHGPRGRHLRAPPAGRHAGDEPRAPGARGARLEASARARSRTSPGSTPCSRTGC